MSDSFVGTLAQLCAEQYEDDFEKLIAQMKEHCEQTDYSLKSNEELIITAGILRSCKWEVVIRIIFTSMRLSWKDACKLSDQITTTFGASNLAWLYFHHSDEALLRFYVGVHLELAKLSREMALRTGQKKIRQAVLKFQNNDISSINTLLAAIEQQAQRWRRKSSLQRDSDDTRDRTRDRKQAALLAIQHAYVKVGEEGFESITRLRVPVPCISAIPLTRQHEVVIGKYRAASLRADIAEMARSILPILNGEELPEMAYQAVREEDRKLFAQKRTSIIDFALQRLLREYLSTTAKPGLNNQVRKALSARKFSASEIDLILSRLEGANSKKRLSVIIEKTIQDAQQRTMAAAPASQKSSDGIVLERHLGVWKKDDSKLDMLQEMGLLKQEDGPQTVSLLVQQAKNIVIQRRRTSKSKEAVRVFLDQLIEHGDKTLASEVAKLSRPTRNQILLELRREIQSPTTLPPKK